MSRNFSPTRKKGSLPKTQRKLLLHSRLDQIHDWKERARESFYCANKLADACGVATEHLSRYFLARRGIHLKKWLHRLQMKRAMQIILHAERPAKLYVLAAELGFKSASHFSRVFKKHFGVSPGYAARLGIKSRRRPKKSVFRQKSPFFTSELTRSSPATK